MKKMPNLKNYTTSISSVKSVMEIEQLLGAFGAIAILKEYSGDGCVKSLSFKILTEHGEMPFKLPLKERHIAEYRARQVSALSAKESRKNDLETARRIGWRIIKDWLHSQLSLIQFNMVKPEEVLLPYLYNTVEDKTFYEILKEKQFRGLLPAPKDSADEVVVE